ncbi:MAG: Uncharacterised protein [SAR116 cluster bacterium]|nr:MAG: Uncharacterised protein [SAR116 cluster bacterium]
MPPIEISSSMVSLVVPAISETMARSSFKRAFNKVDFPAFGAPTIATGIPFFMTLPRANESISWRRTLEIFSNRALKASRSAKATSSSAKSNSNSMSDAKFNNSCLKAFISELNPPRICCMAIWCAAALSEAIRSATASAWLRSSLPFKKARRVNSPPSAIWQPFLKNSWSISCCI